MHLVAFEQVISCKQLERLRNLPFQVPSTLQQLAAQGEIKPKLVQEAIDKYQINDVRAADAGNTEGSG